MPPLATKLSSVTGSGGSWGREARRASPGQYFDHGPARVTVLAGVGFASLRAHGDDRRAGFLEAVERIPEFHLLIQIVDEDGDGFARELHANIIGAPAAV